METDFTMPLPWPVGWVLYWPIAVEIIKAFAVPITVLIGFFALTPLVMRILNSGGYIEAFGAKLSVAKQQVEDETRKLNLDVDANIKDDAQAEGAEVNPSILAERPVLEHGLHAIRSGWTLIDQASRDALKSVNAPPWVVGYLNQTPMLAFNWLTQKEWIGFPLRDTLMGLRELHDNALATNGANLTQSAAREFNVAAQKAARAIQNAVGYRIRKRSVESTDK